MIPTIDVDTLQEWLQRGQPVTVLDVRPANEWAEWAIPGSINVDSYAMLQKSLPGALRDAALPDHAPVVAVCRVGKTSQVAARYLRERGYDALSLQGGMKAWSLAWNTADISLAKSRAQVVQVRRTGKGCLSYLVGSAGEAVVIDASSDARLYVELAAARNWRITGVLDTHVHADHLSRSRPLAELTGAALMLPETGRVRFPYRPVRDGEALRVGDAKLTVLHTPGHTPESVCYLLEDEALFTGDTLFLAGIGRPDLEADPVEARARAGALYRSLHRLIQLPPETLVVPSHTSEPVPFDGRPVAAPLAEVRRELSMVDLPEERFIEAVLSKLPPTPPNHHRIVDLNEAGFFAQGDPTDLEAGANRCAVA